MKILYSLPLLSLITLAGCSNSPAPPPYTPPPVPTFATFATPVPPPSIVLDTDKFIAEGNQLVVLEKRIPATAVTKLDQLLYQKTGTHSMSSLSTSLLNEVDASNTSLADALLILKSKIIQRITSVFNDVIGADPRLANLDPNRKAAVPHVKAVQAAVLGYAETKYNVTTRNMTLAEAQPRMAAFRSVALRNARMVDELSYRTITLYERRGVDLSALARRSSTTNTTTTATTATTTTE